MIQESMKGECRMYNVMKYTAYALVLIGALNWGLVGILNFDLVQFLFGDMTIAARIVYGLVGVSAVIVALIGYRCHQTTYCEICKE